MQKQTDLTRILSLSPHNESGTMRVLKLLNAINEQKAAGVSYTRMAEALGLEPAHFRVYLYRAKKRAINPQVSSSGAPMASSVSITLPAAKPVAEPDLMTVEGRKAAQAARFNLDMNHEGED